MRKLITLFLIFGYTQIMAQNLETSFKVKYKNNKIKSELQITNSEIASFLGEFVFSLLFELEFFITSETLIID